MGFQGRMAVPALIAALFVVPPLAAQTPEQAGTSPASEPAPISTGRPHHDFSSHSFRLLLSRHPELLKPVRILDLSYDRAVRMALWNDPMTRLLYAMAAEESMIGRTGLVNGGRMLGAGLAMTALGGAVSPISAYVDMFLPGTASSQVSAGAHAGGDGGNPPAPASPAGPPDQ